MNSKVIHETYYAEDGDTCYAEIPVEITITWDLSAPYDYGSDYDGRRGEIRQDIENVTIQDITIPTEGDLSEFLCDEIRDYYENLGGEYFKGSAE